MLIFSRVMPSLCSSKQKQLYRYLYDKTKANGNNYLIVPYSWCNSSSIQCFPTQNFLIPFLESIKKAAFCLTMKDLAKVSICFDSIEHVYMNSSIRIV